MKKIDVIEKIKIENQCTNLENDMKNVLDVIQKQVTVSQIQ